MCLKKNAPTLKSNNSLTIINKKNKYVTCLSCRSQVLYLSIKKNKFENLLIDDTGNLKGNFWK